MLLKREPFGFYKPVDYPCTIQNYLLWYPVWSTSEETSHCFHFLQCLENHKCDSDDPHKAFLSLNITLWKKKLAVTKEVIKAKELHLKKQMPACYSKMEANLLHSVSRMVLTHFHCHCSKSCPKVLLRSIIIWFHFDLPNDYFLLQI